MGLNRTTLYYKPKGESAEIYLKMMEMMDKYYLDHPTGRCSHDGEYAHISGYDGRRQACAPFDAEDGTDGHLSSEVLVLRESQSTSIRICYAILG